MFLFPKICLLSVLCALVYGRTSDILKVTLPHGGVLVGRYLVSHDGHGIRAFMGVPYAEPPINELRFKEPVPVKPWIGERLAVKDSAICTQRDPFRRDQEIEGSEDCLYINVYVPQFPKSSKPLPVMIFFHGGGLMCGSGVSTFYGPDFLLDHDVIYIGANYRLGPLGFLSTGTKDCPGNNGFKDQVQILRWIQENIASFGGDPNSVTIFGESAGGASATYHMMSPLSKGLFHKAISESGTNLNPWAQPAHEGVAQKRAAELGEMMGCPKKLGKNNWADMLNCLRSVPADKITAAFYDFFEWDTDPMVPFPPVVEIDLPGAFITKHPRDEINPHGKSIPWIVGITTDEGALKSAAILNSEKLWKEFNDNWHKAMSVSLYYHHHDSKEQNAILKNINDFYFNGEQLTTRTKQNFTNIYTDSWFLAGIDEYLKIRLLGNPTVKNAATYVYLFAHKGAASLTEIFKGGRETYYGVCHAEELQFLFPLGKELFVSAAPTKEDTEIRRAMTKMWVDFAKTGEPTPDPSSTPQWKTTKKYPLNYLRIGNIEDTSKSLFGMEQGLMEDRATFWNLLGAHLSANSIVKYEL